MLNYLIYGWLHYNIKLISLSDLSLAGIVFFLIFCLHYPKATRPFRLVKRFNVACTTLLCSHIFLVLRDHGVYMYVVYIWKWSSAHALRDVSGVATSLLLMNGFNKTEAAVFSCRLCFLRAFLFISFISGRVDTCFQVMI